VRALHDLPLLELVHQAQTVHREAFGDNKVQLCSLLSIKTGGCPEDCAYCPQAARYHTGVEAEPLMETSEVLASARSAREAGATRFCMGAAWREVKDGAQFDRVLEMVRGVRTLGLEACCTLGMLTSEQARRLKEAGCTAYNPQPRHQPGRVLEHHHHARVRRPPAHAAECARGRDHHLLGRDHRHGRVGGRSLRDAAHARRAGPSPRVGPHQHARARGGDAARRAAAGLHAGDGAHDRDRPAC